MGSLSVVHIIKVGVGIAQCWAICYYVHYLFVSQDASVAYSRQWSHLSAELQGFRCW